MQKTLKPCKKKKCHVRKDSHIFKLDPYLEGGVLRVGGQLSRSAMPLEARHPAILHKDRWTAKLIFRHIHEETSHLGRNYILTRLRQKYWILKACSAIQEWSQSVAHAEDYMPRQVKKKCQTYQRTGYCHPSQTLVWTILAHRGQ